MQEIVEKSCDGKAPLTKSLWTKDEDETLLSLMEETKSKSWTLLAKQLHNRTGKQCRERWVNHLDPNINKNPWTAAEDLKLIKLQAQLGNRWVEFTRELPQRSENSVKNRWNLIMKRRSAKLRGSDLRSKPKPSATSSPGGTSKARKGRSRKQVGARMMKPGRNLRQEMTLKEQIVLNPDVELETLSPTSESASSGLHMPEPEDKPVLDFSSGLGYDELNSSEIGISREEIEAIFDSRPAEIAPVAVEPIVWEDCFK
ncbi:hypothetical protein NDN08_000798 [Rhodosorus marinus]|uniref:Uncharacterized protein n=1 Tax=Rhodosorus marinus TaxID=101924 RepID=A0AAV8UP07_9RHOD|nr:hypothetical protein NDN08_000798 [Rhodosorus marinus]